MTTYEVIARRTGDWWALEVPAVPGAYSQCKRLDQAAEMAREAIALVLDIDEDDIEVEVEADLPAKVQRIVTVFRKAREKQERAAQQAQHMQANAIRDLVRSCQLSYRDVGQIVGLSHQRVGQVLKDVESNSVDSERVDA